MSLESVLRRASKLVVPTEAESKRLERVVQIVNGLLDKVFAGVADAEKPSIALGGSYAKGTWLKGAHDIDFFLQYPKEYPREKLESEAIDLAKLSVKNYKINMRYAEHPYVESFIEGVRVNLVPCYKVERGAWLSAADRSPYHAEYVKSKFDDSLRHEARLLKKFTKACGIYGAEVRIQGFSGYVCEVLVLKYGSFTKVMEVLSEIRHREVISIEPYDKTLTALFTSPVVILDPVDTTRNLGAAISERNVAKLALQSRRFLERPSVSFFVPKQGQKKISPQTKVLLQRTVVVEFRNKKRSPDILWGQLRKSSHALAEKIGFLDFHVLRVGAASDEMVNSALLFLLLETKVGVLQIRNGPEYFRRQETKDYNLKNKTKSLFTFIGEDGRLRSLRMRPTEFTDAAKAVKSLISKKLDTLGLSKEIRTEIRSGLVVETGYEAVHRFRHPDHWLVRELMAIANEE